MISINFSQMNNAGVLYIEAAGLSTDTKPGGVATGSIFAEVDTGKIYLFDEESDWTEELSLQE